MAARPRSTTARYHSGPSRTGTDRVETLQSARLYFWPIIAANALAMSAGTGVDPYRMAWFAGVLAALASFGFILNDLLDRRIDLVNAAGHYERAAGHALVVGWVAAAALFAAAASIAWWLGDREYRLAMALSVPLIVYSPLLRRLALVANVTTAALASSPLWAPMILADAPIALWRLGLLSGAAVFLVAREIVMDVRDRTGDAAGGRRTLVTWIGPRRSLLAAIGLGGAGVTMLALAIAIGAAGLDRASAMAVIAAGGAVLGLVLSPLSRLRAGTAGDDAAAIRLFVRRSRLMMLGLPAIVLLLSGRS
jgi:4-hydroxybenzoate polyprenyltransferase